MPLSTPFHSLECPSFVNYTTLQLFLLPFFLLGIRIPPYNNPFSTRRPITRHFFYTHKWRHADFQVELTVIVHSWTNFSMTWHRPTSFSIIITFSPKGLNARQTASSDNVAIALPERWSSCFPNSFLHNLLSEPRTVCSAATIKNQLARISWQYWTETGNFRNVIPFFNPFL